MTDPWIAKGMTKREADGATAELVLQADAHPTNLDMLRRRLADGLADGLARHGDTSPPAFELVEVCEVLRLGGVAKRRTDPIDMLGELLDGVPAEQTNAAALRWAHQESLRWGEYGGAIETWFDETWVEAGADVEALLRPIRGRAKREAAVLKQLLSQRRAFWVEQLAWTAAALKDNAGETPIWREMARVGLDLAEAGDVADVPLMQGIAIDTARAFGER